MHKNKVIHRNLKSSTILLDSNYEPVISNFGSSWQFLDRKDIGQEHLVGSIIFIPPEMYQNDIDPYYGSAVDIYAFNIVMYQIIALIKSEDVYKFDMNDELKMISYHYLINHRKFENIIPHLGINEIFDTLIKKCWNAIIDEILLPGQNTDELKEYIRRLNQAQQ